MAIEITQKPLYNTLAAAQPIIFVVNENTNIIQNESMVKYVAELFIGNEMSTAQSVGNFKVSPNATGVGIFDFSPILENYVTPDYNGVYNQIGVQPFPNSASRSSFRLFGYTENAKYHPVHLVDEYCLSSKSTQFVGIIFRIEYLGAQGNPDLVQIDGTMTTVSDEYLIFNGVVDDTDTLTPYANSPNFGYNLGSYAGRRSYIMLNDASGKARGNFLTDAPTTQYARLDDYGTFPFFNNLDKNKQGFGVGPLNPTTGQFPVLKDIEIKLYDCDGGTAGTTFYVTNLEENGGWSGNTGDNVGARFYAQNRIIYFGGFPANLRGANHEHFINNLDKIAYYTLQARDNNNDDIGALQTVWIIDPESSNIRYGLGYTPIRLTWLNKHGTWDYYTFKQKSVRSIKTNRTNYTQITGTWNSDSYHLRGSQGGQKNFRVNSQEKIIINTGLITDDEAVWLEQLLNSTDVYIIQDYNSEGAFPTSGNINRYIEPVTVTTSNYIRKTKVNDSVIQYTFELERATIRRTQSV